MNKNGNRLLFSTRQMCVMVLLVVLVLSAASAQAAVTGLDSWSKQLTTANASPQSFTYTISPGTSRLLVVAITTKYGAAGTRSYSASYGGKPLTVIAQYNTGRDNTWVGYLKEADIAGRSGNSIRVTYGGTPNNTKVFVASYQNVEQSAPITSANGNGSNTAVTSLTFGKSITIGSGDQLFYVAHSGSGTASHTPPTGYSEPLQDTGNGMSVSMGLRNSTAAGSVNQTVRFSASSPASLVVASLKQASTSADLTLPTVTAFTIPATAAALTIPVTTFTATDNVAVTGYLLTESATPPLPAAAWSATAPASYTFAAAGSKTLYAWARDAAGNISAARSATVTVTLAGDTTAPTVTAFTVPASSTSLTVPISTLSATDDVGVTGYLVTETAAAPSPSASGWTATPPASYIFTTAGSKTLYAWARDAAGNVSASKSATVAVTVAAGNPILIVTSSANPFSTYYTEILRAEGFNSFTVSDIASLSAAQLASYDVVVLGEMPLTTGQVTMFSDWVTAGGNLVAMRPDKALAGLLGLSDRSATASNGYLLVDTASGPGKGLVNETIQFHGTADLYTLSGATSLATLYLNAGTASPSPAVTLNSVGSAGGKAAAFAYDLARSVVYTRQGNPAWSGQERDGFPPIRSDDLAYGAASFDPQPDWVDLNKVAIPQADEQQRLLANLIIQMNFAKRPLPRFWYLPRSLAAAVVMTGDDHGNGATAGRFDAYKAMSPANCSVANWECIRGTSYIYPATPLTNAQAAAYDAAGFEIGLHLTTNCGDWTASSLQSFYTDQLGVWGAKYNLLPAPVTNRTHCIAWSDFATQPAVEVAHGIRLDTNYYFWPSTWVGDRPGLFTGSAIPMRFADPSGNMIDAYQAPTQMTDESGQSYPFTIDTLLDRAVGALGYYGVFVVNAHTDVVASSVSDAVVTSAVARGVPVITSRQLLTWLDGRNGSAFNSIAWSGDTLTFSVTTAPGATGLTAMVPVPDKQKVTGVTNNGSAVTYTMKRVKGMQYAAFPASAGAYRVSYGPYVTPPVVSSVTPQNGATGVSATAKVSASFSAAMDLASFTSATFELRTAANVPVSAAVSYNGATQTVTLTPNPPLDYQTSYVATVKGGASGVRDTAGNLLAQDYTWSFSTAAPPAGSFSIWPSTTVPGLVDSGPDTPVELGVKFKSDSSGYVTGIRFYKASTNVGTHVGNLWSSAGALLATGIFSNETASGWQQLTFTTPVAITANTVYVASYHTSAGHYSADLNFFQGKGVDNPPLHALADGVSGFNGVFAYGTPSSFPNQGWYSSNYWVDVTFSNILPSQQTLGGAQTQAVSEPGQAVQQVTLSSIAITPDNQRIAMRTQQQFSAIGTFSDGSRKEITGQVTWSSSDSKVVAISSSGLANAVSLGRVTISATLNGVTGSTSPTVTEGVASLSRDLLGAGTMYQ